MRELFMGIDIGTTGVRAALFDADGNQKALSYMEYPTICTQSGMSELDPHKVFESLIEVAGDCVRSAQAGLNELQAIGLSTQMHSLVAMDSEGANLTNVLTWADIRASEQAASIKERFDCGKLYEDTGCRVQHPMYPLSKVLWLRQRYPEIFAKTGKLVSIKGYVLHRLFSRYVMDYTDASTTGYFNLHKFDWDDGILSNILEIKRDILGDVVECTTLLKGMKPEYAEAMGVRADVPVAAGSGDGILANVGCGIFDDTAMSCTIGTSGAIRVAVDKPLLDPLQRTWCYCFTKDTWVAGGAINNGGIVLKWLRDNYREQFTAEAERAGYRSAYALFDEYARQVPAGSDGLIFLPFLTGERSPNWNAAARGIMCGIDYMHDKRHLVKASMEGVMYRMYSVYEALASICGNVGQIRANGGYTGSDIWLQIQADIFGKEIAVAGVQEASVFGAAYLSMAAAGAIGSLKCQLPAMEVKTVIKPVKDNIAVYAKGYARFIDIYERLFTGDRSCQA